MDLCNDQFDVTTRDRLAMRSLLVNMQMVKEYCQGFQAGREHREGTRLPIVMNC